MGTEPSHVEESDLPVGMVDWVMVQEFLKKLNARQDGYRYRLPTEAEWEYAARAGSSGKYTGPLDAMAWHAGNSGDQYHPVGQKQANAWGLYDMQGNVWEWCQDWYDENYYQNSPAQDPQGPSPGRNRTLRGGSESSDARRLRVSFRGWEGPFNWSDAIGFRCVREKSLPVAGS